MTAEEALEICRLAKSCFGNLHFVYSQEEFIKEIAEQEDIEIMIQSLEKQIPKKPLPDKEFHLKGICPTCGVHFLDKLTKYCGNCGQKLKWEDEENDS